MLARTEGKEERRKEAPVILFDSCLQGGSGICLLSSTTAPSLWLGITSVVPVPKAHSSRPGATGPSAGCASASKVRGLICELGLGGARPGRRARQGNSGGKGTRRRRSRGVTDDFRNSPGLYVCHQVWLKQEKWYYIRRRIKLGGVLLEGCSRRSSLWVVSLNASPRDRTVPSPSSPPPPPPFALSIAFYAPAATTHHPNRSPSAQEQTSLGRAGTSPRAPPLGFSSRTEA